MKKSAIEKQYELIKTHIRNARLNDAFEILEAFIKESSDDKELNRQLILTSARYSEENKANRLGINENSTEHIKITNALLDILEETRREALSIAEKKEGWLAGFLKTAKSVVNMEAIAKTISEEDIKQFWVYLNPNIRAVVLEKYISEIVATNKMSKQDIIRIFDLTEESYLLIENRDEKMLPPTS